MCKRFFNTVISSVVLLTMTQSAAANDFSNLYSFVTSPLGDGTVLLTGVELRPDVEQRLPPDIAPDEIPLLVTSLTIPSGIGKIAPSAIGQFSNLRQLTIEDSSSPLICDDFPSGCYDLVYVGRNLEGYTYFNSFEPGVGKIAFGDKVTKVVSYCANTDLTSVSFGNSVEEIGEGVFSECKSLKEVVFPESLRKIGNYAFSSCESLASIVIPRNVTEIGYWAFMDCTSLKDVRIDDSDETLTVWGAYYHQPWEGSGTRWPFHGDPIENLYLGRNSYLRDTAYEYEIEQVAGPFYNIPELKQLTLGDNVTQLWPLMFGANTGLENVNYGSGVTYLPKELFSGCTSLKKIEIPDCVTSMGESAFIGCHAASELKLSAAMTSIPEFAFYECSSIGSVDIHARIDTIAGDAFAGCQSLRSVRIESSPKPINIGFRIRESAFQGAPIEDLWIGRNVSWYFGEPISGFGGPFYDIQSLKTLSFGEEVTEIMGCYYSENLVELNLGSRLEKIDDDAFNGCVSLKDVSFPASLREIGDVAFAGCAVENIILPEGLTKIGWACFYGCANIKKVYIPSTLVNIPDQSFLCIESSALEELTISEGVESIGTLAFGGCVNLERIEIPSSVKIIEPSAFEARSDSNPEERSDLKEIIIKDSDTELELHTAFDGADVSIPLSSLSKVYVGRDLKTDGQMFITAGNPLMEVVIGDMVRRVPDKLFDGCTSIENITIGNSLNEIGSRAFASCDRLKNISVSSTVPPVCASENVFASGAYENAQLTVPESADAEYVAAPVWTLFKNRRTADVSSIEDDDVEYVIQGLNICFNDVVLGRQIEIYDMDGHMLYRGEAGSFMFPGKGLYILRMNGKTRKLAI